jgi:hypothetical protein
MSKSTHVHNKTQRLIHIWVKIAPCPLLDSKDHDWADYGYKQDSFDLSVSTLNCIGSASCSHFAWTIILIWDKDN